MKLIKYLVIGWMIGALAIMASGCSSEDSVIDLNNCNVSTQYKVTRMELVDNPGFNWQSIEIEGYKECDPNQTVFARLISTQGMSMPVYLWFETYWEGLEYVYFTEGADQGRWEVIFN